jgi:hypothetical protein
MADEERAKLAAIVEQHKDKNFVQRIADPQKVPAIDLGGGMTGTHMMSYATDDKGGAIVYPEIIQDQSTGNLVRLGRNEAKAHAIKTGEFIPFGKAADAEWFGKNYKKLWEQPAATVTGRSPLTVTAQ